MSCPCEEASVFACVTAAWHTWLGVVIGRVPGHELPELRSTVCRMIPAHTGWFLGHGLPCATCPTRSKTP